MPDLYQIEKEEGIYRLTVKSKTGKDILNEEYQVEPTIMAINDDTLLRICGRGDWHTYKFMNVTTGMVSEEFDDASAWTSKLVVYAVLEGGVNKIVIRDIYDKEEYYKEIERDFSPMAIPHHIIKKAEFLDNTKLALQYYCGDDLEIKEETIIL